jgi:uncharacterized OB-fold protein
MLTGSGSEEIAVQALHKGAIDNIPKDSLSGYKIRGWICEKCQTVDSGVKDKCPYCGSRTSEVDVIEELIEFAERTDTKVEFVEDNPILASVYMWLLVP